MLFQLVFFILAALIVVLSVVMYTPLPEGITDPYKTHIFMGFCNLMPYVFKLCEYVGYGTLRKGTSFMQTPIQLEGPVASSKYGDVQVRRDTFDNVPVIIYRPNMAAAVSPAMVYFHGGGWVLLTADEYDATTYNLAKDANIVVISVDYRRAPQFPFPAAAQDCLAVTRYVLKNGINLGIDVNKVGVAGDSAGGNLAAVVALAISKEKNDLPPLQFQVLFFPVLQAFDFRLPSYIDLNNTLPILTTRLMAGLTSLYMGLDEDKTEYYALLMSENRHISPELKKSAFADYVSVKNLPLKYRAPNKTALVVTSPYDSQLFSKIKNIVIDPMFSPLMAPDLTGLPPAFIQVCEFDVLRDEAMMYAKRLQDAGVKVNVHFGRGGFHADVLRMVPDFLWVESGRIAYIAACDYITSMLKV